MKIKYIDGKRFNRGIKAGAKKVVDNQDYLNDINVFPVPDADTGTNMASTMKSVVDGIENQETESIDASSRQVADAALKGARGNSGVILAQFFHGLATGLEKSIKVTTEQFGQAVQKAKDAAFEALNQPKDGTILTVIKDWAENVYENRKKHIDFHDLLHNSLEAAKHSLESTRDKIDSIRKAHVVDSGAQGFVYILEGITDFLKRGRIKDIEKSEVIKLETGVAHTDISIEDIKYRYCTECLIEGQKIDLKKIRHQIEKFGNSIVVAGSEYRARLHIHTNEPAEVFAIARQYGDLLQQKADDMKKQYLVTHFPHPKIALVVDSACDLPQEFIDEHQIHVIPVRVSFGNSTYIDKITITPDYFYQMLLSDPNHPKTSQPPPADFKNLYAFLLSHYESVISIHLPEAASGTYQNAAAAAKSFPEKKISVIDSKSLSIGFGFVAEKAARLIEEGKTHDEIVKEVIAFTKRTQIFVSIPSLKYLMRSGRVSRAKGFIAKVLNIKPILNIDSRGMPQHFSKSFSDWGAVKKVFRITMKFIKDKQSVRFIVAHANDLKKAEYLANRLKEKFGDIPIPILPVAPVLGAHTGNGAAAIGISWEE
ncbi:MAG: DegV family EDD domain-containing protein [Candidatus Marinimicrobia bacterium]|nr:DegV family EDD domain-containing protein [Candidatus Neomarinimicrobiota bacterium]